MKSRLHVSLFSLLALSGCGSASADDEQRAGVDRADEVVGAAILAEPAEPVAAAETGEEPDEFVPAPAEAAVQPAEQAAEPEPEPEVESEPVERRIARQLLTIYAEPKSSAPIRGRIPMAAAFDVFGYVEGDGCEGDLGWADLGSHGFACMTDTRSGKGATAYHQPKMRAPLTPFFYAKVKKGHPAPRYRNLKALRRGDEPIGTLKEGVDYAFIIRRRVDGRIVLIDDKRRAVLESDVRRFRPSYFEGRDLEAEPVPEGKLLAWVANWPEAPSYERASARSALAHSVGYHDQLLVEPADTDGWYELPDGAFITASDVRVFMPPAARPEAVGAGDIWLDIDLDQQMLTIMLGDEPIFATLVSSGLKAPTPRGIYRIHNKLASGSMSSSPGADDFYDVQAVPHIQYFAGSFALHSAYWHNGFGRPISHGCVNLSPKDAKRVFSLTTPTLRPGWIHGYESTEHLGTTVRIHDGDKPIRDRRRDAEAVLGR